MLIGHIFNSIYLVGLSVGFPPDIVRCQVFVGNKFRLFAHRDQRRKMNWAFVCQILRNPFGHLVRNTDQIKKKKKGDLPWLQWISAINGKWCVSDNFKRLLFSTVESDQTTNTLSNILMMMTSEPANPLPCSFCSWIVSVKMRPLSFSPYLSPLVLEEIQKNESWTRQEAFVHSF